MDKSVIPKGDYCDECPYWKYLGTVKYHANPPNETYTQCIYESVCKKSDRCWKKKSTECQRKIVRCEYLDLTDNEENTLLWDKCKVCGVNLEDEGMHSKDIVGEYHVYGLEKSIEVAQYPKLTDISKAKLQMPEGIRKLGMTAPGTGHCNFLKGIIVQMDVTFTVKVWTEAERYHWFDIVSSQSTMHKISQMDFRKSCIEYTDSRIIDIMTELRDIYNDTKDKTDYLRLLYSCPTGLKLTAGVTTNYLQLKTIYQQRKNHRLPEWRLFCEWMKTLPHSEWITGENADNML